MDKRTHIISKALGLFANAGFDHTSIREICQEAGVNVAMINYYFGSKEKLFEAMIEYKANHLREKLEEINADPALDELQKIHSIIREYVDRILSNPFYHRILHQERLLNARPGVNATIEKIVSQNSLIIKNIVEEGIRKKRFRKVDPELTLASVMGTINHILLTPAVYTVVHQSSQEPDPYKDKQLRTRLIRHLEDLTRAHLLNN